MTVDATERLSQHALSKDPLYGNRAMADLKESFESLQPEDREALYSYLKIGGQLL